MSPPLAPSNVVVTDQENVTVAAQPAVFKLGDTATLANAPARVLPGVSRPVVEVTLVNALDPALLAV